MLILGRVGDIELPDMHPRKSFMTAALDKEIRLSFAQRIKGTLPEPYHTLIPEKKGQDIPDFKYNDEQAPFAALGTQVAQLIRRKAPDADLAPIMEEIEQTAAAENLDPSLVSTDVYVTSICFVGSKSLSHFLSCIERCKDRLLSLGPKSPTARNQIITSVMEYWQDQPGVGVSIVDKLLNYTILAPTSVVTWVLVDKVEQGAMLAKGYAFEMVSLTVSKVTKRVRQIVQAIRRPGLPVEQTTMLQDTLERERGDMQRLFGLIEEQLSPFASGSMDEEIAEAGQTRDGNDSGDDDEDSNNKNKPSTAVREQASVHQWGLRWLRVFQRRFVVEESWITEELVKPLPPMPSSPAPAAAPAEDGAASDSALALAAHNQNKDVAQIDGVDGGGVTGAMNVDGIDGDVGIADYGTMASDAAMATATATAAVE